MCNLFKIGQSRPLFALFFKTNGPTPASFLFFLGLFLTNNTILATNECEKCPSNIQRRDLNPRPLDHESSPITTRPGLPPLGLFGLFLSFRIATFTLSKEKVGCHAWDSNPGLHMLQKMVIVK